MIMIIIIIVLIVLSIVAGLVYKNKVAADAEALEAEALEAALEALEAEEALEALEAEEAEEAEAAVALAAAPVSFDGKVLNSINNPSQCIYMQNGKKAQLGLCKYSKKDTGPYSLHLNGTLRSHDLMKKGVDKCIKDDAWSGSCDQSDKNTVLWDYIPETKQLKNKKNNKCLTTNNKTWKTLYPADCDASLKNQQWGFAE
jgi:hypothetical protein